MNQQPILIVGAGPTGLVLALWLTRLGIKVRIIDKVAGPGTTSRALVVHARTLEFYRQMGLAKDVIERGLKFGAAHFWVAKKKVGHIELGHMGDDLSLFPYMIIFPQDEHERLLIEKLKEQNIDVEWQTELLGFDDKGPIKAQIRKPDGSKEICEAAYLAGCDGARSKVREVLETGFPGSTYKQLFFVADVKISGPLSDHALHLSLDEADFLAVFPMKGEGKARLIGIVTPGAELEKREIKWNDVSQDVVRHLGVDVEQINWFSTYHVHHRVTSHFRKGNAFLLGDAAHIHSPVGGQGMNTGIGDAVNLAWKLSSVLKGSDDSKILDTYEPERMAFAKRLVATTDQGFTFITSTGPLARQGRVRIVPWLIPLLFKLRVMRRFLFRTVSQIAINYRESALSAGRVGEVHGGDRLPWVKLQDKDNFESLSFLEWQVHVYGTAPEGLTKICHERKLSLHVFSWQDEMRKRGITNSAIYLIRPDGYVGWVGQNNLSDLERYLDGRKRLA